MSKTWKQITQELNEAKFKLPKDQEEVKRETQKVSMALLKKKQKEILLDSIYLFQFLENLI